MWVEPSFGSQILQPEARVVRGDSLAKLFTAARVDTSNPDSNPV